MNASLALSPSRAITAGFAPSHRSALCSASSASYPPSGRYSLRKVALKAAVFATFSERREPCEQFDPLSFWKHAVYAGVAARSLASASEVFANIHPEDVYMAGLLHDIGRIICMEDQGSRHLESMHKSPQENRSEVGHEFEHSGLTHADVGSAMASRWSLPANLINAIKYNRAPSRDPFEQPLSALVHLASHLAKRAQATPTLGAALSSLNHDVYESIALSLEQVEEILPQIADDFTVAELPW